MKAPSDLECSFCGRSQSAVRLLVHGPLGNICDGCVAICDDIIAEKLEPEEAPRASSPEPTFVCGLCSLQSASAQGTLIPGRGALCVACLDAVIEAYERKGSVEGPRTR